MNQENLPVPLEALDDLPVPVAAEVLERLTDENGQIFLRYPHQAAEETGLVPLIAREHAPKGIPKGVILSPQGVFVYPERAPVPFSQFLRRLLAKVPPLIDSLREVCQQIAKRHPGLLQGLVAQAPDRTFPPSREAYVEEDGRRRPLRVYYPAPGM